MLAHHQPPRPAHAIKLVALAVAVTLLAGCGAGGGPKANLSGQVTINGKPIPEGAEARIGFEAIGGDGQGMVAVPIEGGRYDAKGVPTGKVLVRFFVINFGPTKVSDRTGREYREETSLVPADKAGGIQIDVTGDNANQHFDL